MDREELIGILERLVRSGRITTEEAGEILAKFDRGELTEDDLPLSDGDSLILILFPQLYLALQSRYLLLASLPARVRYDERFTIAGDFFTDAERLAARLASTGNYRQFQQDAMEAIRNTLVRQLVLGKSAQLTSAEVARARAGTLTPEEIQAIARRIVTQGDIDRLSEEALTQSAYLKRFMDQAAAAEAAGKPFSEAYITNRFQLYGGAGIGVFYKTIEAPLGPGWVVDYISRDDQWTCSPCLRSEEEGPYLPGEGPMPGVVCLGKRRCRCHRQPRFDRETYDRLIRRAA